MFIYLFPIFAFGLVITGVVFLGLQQASDWAKDLAAQSLKVKAISSNLEGVPAGGNTAPPNPPSRERQQ
jgi:hypothetical protein